MSIVIKDVLRVSDGSRTYYLGSFKPEQIKSLTFVPVVAASPDESSVHLNERAGGYQRSGDSKRMNEIQKFLNERPSAVLPPVLLSPRGKWTFTENSTRTPSFGQLEAEDLAAIVDGQHRLGGLWRVAVDKESDPEARKRSIPFMAVDLESREEELAFIEINDNQKGVKKSLFQYLAREEHFAGRAALAMKEDAESVFRDRVSIEDRRDWHLITFGAMKECIDLSYHKQFLTTRELDATNRDDQQTLMEYLLKYWQAVARSFAEAWSDMRQMPAPGSRKTKGSGRSKFEYRLLEETGIRAFSKLMPELFSRCWMRELRAPAMEQVEEILKRMYENERCMRALLKPTPEILKWDPELKLSGKAGVEAIFKHLKTAADDVAARR